MGGSPTGGAQWVEINGGLFSGGDRVELVSVSKNSCVFDGVSGGSGATCGTSGMMSREKLRSRISRGKSRFDRGSSVR